MCIHTYTTQLRGGGNDDDKGTTWGHHIGTHGLGGLLQRSLLTPGRAPYAVPYDVPCAVYSVFTLQARVREGSHVPGDWARRPVSVAMPLT